jgi:divalent metal cation (Fe/Co/Zn/Cd) transporter
MSLNLMKKALLLSYITVGYNLLEGIVSLIAGALANSIALTGFGLDSFVESLSGIIMVWRLRHHDRLDGEAEERMEHRALRLIGATSFIFGGYVLYESVRKLYLTEIPKPSLFGIIIALVSLIAMPVLFVQKYRTGKALGLKSLIADSKETFACVFLSSSLLVGLTLNYVWKLWWADPVIGLVIVYFLVREGIEVFGEDD